MDALTKVLDAKERAASHRKPKEEKWKKFYKMYRSYLEEKKEDKSNIFVPYIFGIVEAVVPRLTDTIFRQKPYLRPLPRTTDDIQAAEGMESLLDYQMDKMKMKRKCTEWFKEACMYGPGILKVIWKTRKHKVTERVPKPINNPLDVYESLINGRFEEVEREVKEYDGPDIEVVDIFDFYVDPYAEDIDDARYVIHRSVKSMKHIRSMARKGIYHNIDNIGSGEAPDHEASKRQADIEQATVPMHDDEMVEILEYWENDRVITVANETVIRDEPNPYHHKKIPFVKVVDTQVPKEFWGIGEVEPNEKLQHELNTLRNQRIDNLSLAINNMFLVSSQAGIDPDELVWRPNGIVWTNKPDVREAMQQIGPTNVSPSAYQEEEVAKRDMQETSAVVQYIKGVEPSGEATATEITSLQREANYRFMQKIRNMIDGLERVGELMVAMNQQFVTEEQMVRIGGERSLQWMQPTAEGEGFQFLQISPDDIAGQFDIQVASTALEPNADRQVRRQQLLELLQILTQSTGVPSMKLLEELLKTYDMPVTEEITDEIMQMIQQQPPPEGSPDMPETGQTPDQQGLMQRIMGAVGGG